MSVGTLGGEVVRICDSKVQLWRGRSGLEGGLEVGSGVVCGALGPSTSASRSGLHDSMFCSRGQSR